MRSNLPPGCTDEAIERAAGWRPRQAKKSPPAFFCECGWRGNTPIQAECPTCPDCGFPALKAARVKA